MKDWGWLSFIPLVLLAIAAFRQLNPKVPKSAPKEDEEDPNWQTKLEVVTGQSFLNCEVRLDGYRYTRCQFKNVTFLFGGGYFMLDHSEIGPHTIRPTVKSMDRLVMLMMNLGHVKSPLHTGDGLITVADLDRRFENQRPS